MLIGQKKKYYLHAYWTEKEILFGNRANDTIFVLVGSGRPFTSVEAMEKYERGWASQIPPSGHSTEHVLDAEERIVYCAILRKQTLDKYSKEEIVEKNLVELYSYSYQDLKKMDFKIVYSDFHDIAHKTLKNNKRKNIQSTESV